MDKITCSLQNCYGIRNLNCEFDFTNTNAITIYAKNGLMKTSFSKTFRKIQEKKMSEIKDEIFENTGCVDVRIDGKSISQQDVFVINSFESFYESESITALLVNDDIKKQISTVLKQKDKLLKILEKYSGLKISKISSGKKVFELEPTIVGDFNFLEDSFLLNIDAIGALKPDVLCSNIRYCSIFDDVVLKKIKSPEFQGKIEEFCIASDEIYSRFGFLDKGKFTLPKLKNLSKILEGDSFFVKDNHIYLDGGFEINSVSELQDKIKEIDETIKHVPVFNEIERMLSDTKGILLKDLIENNPHILSYLKVENLNDLKKQMWLSYIESERNEFETLLLEYKKLGKAISNIDLDATPWMKALEIFEERFTVPYKMKISNMKGAIIGESVPRVEFSFERDGNVVKLSRNELEKIDVLSQGEKRALYLLNIIFDIEKIKSSGREVLFIVDDIADSFDYKNKYAIVEYLYEMATDDKFRLLILSHNFDFYRTVSSRLGIDRESRLVAENNGKSIVLEQEKYQNQPFKAWKDDMTIINVLALIPFVRNLIEFGKDENVGQIPGIENDFVLLTHLLHEKSETNNITFDTLSTLYNHYLGKNTFQKEIIPTDRVVDKLYEIAENITERDSHLEYKIIMAIAIRHKAEMYILSKFKTYTGNLTWKVKRNIKTGSVTDFMVHLESSTCQTRILINAYKQVFSDKTAKVLEEVNIMTPENIHLNSFMYEPILDMDINELLNLYQRVKMLK